MTQVEIKVDLKNSAFLREIPKESLIRMNLEEGRISGLKNKYSI